MSKMSYLAKLLDGVGVEWFPLGDVTQYEQPTNYLVAEKNYSDEFDTPVLTAGKTFILGYTEEVDGIYQASQSPVIIFDDFTTANKWVDFDFKVKSSAMKMITSRDENSVLLKYIYYWLNTLPNELVDGDHKRQWIGTFISKRIPIPCPDNPKKSLEIQAEIVRRLDAFTSLTAELIAELTLRKKQYNHYRDQLLSFEDGDVEWKTLGEVSNITIGEFVRKDKQNSNAKYPVYNGGRTPTGYYEEYNNDGDKIVVSARGANAGFVNKSSTPYWAGNSCYSISVQDADKLNWMYVYYYLKQSEGRLTGIQQKGGIPAVSKKQMEDFLLPIPSLAEQSRIVAILDKFDALTHSLTEGLPREIELRQKQYEYYRDLLLSFPKPGDSVSGDKQSPGSHA